MRERKDAKKKKREGEKSPKQFEKHEQKSFKQKDDKDTNSNMNMFKTPNLVSVGV